MEANMGGEKNLGFAEKYLAKHGYKGGGLGINEQGILDPIEAKLRPKNMGLGFTNHHTYHKQPEKSSPCFTQRSSKLKYPSNRTCIDKKRKHDVTPEELMTRKSKEHRPIVPKIIDMTKPQVRVLTDLSSLNTSEYYDSTPQVEVERNWFKVQFVKKIDDKEVERRNGTAYKKQQYFANVEEITKEIDEEEVERRNGTERKNQQYSANKEEIMRVLGQIDENKNLTLEFLVTIFMDLQMRYVEEYVLFDLSTIACSYAMPLFTKMFQGWNMLQSPNLGVVILGMWKGLLLGKDNNKYSHVYTQLVIDVVYPAVRVTVTRYWDVKDAGPMIKFLDCWYELLPTRVMQMILDNVVMPKLLAGVMYWDPIKDVVPIDCWIHPWLPLLGPKIGRSCCQTIRDGFVRMLRVWEPADMSAYNALSPWKSVFGSKTWEKLIDRYVVPKLMSFMDRLQIKRVECNKVDQFQWASAIPNQHMLRIMDIFFNKWQIVLYQWLCDNPKFEEVGKWYLGWKEELPPELEENEYIQYRLSIGLTMMGMAVEGLEVAPPCIVKIKDRLRKREGKRATFMDGINAEDASGGCEISLKEVVEIYAQQNDLLFTPKFGRTRAGLQIYGFGNVSVVIDSLNQKVFARIENGSSPWSSVCLDQLLKLHHHAAYRR